MAYDIEDMDKVQLIYERFKTSQICQKSYGDVRRRGQKFVISDWVFLKVSPMKGVIGLVEK